MADDVLEIRVQIDARAAIVAGKTAVGNRKLLVTSEGLSKLPVELREELAAAYENGDVLGAALGDLAIVEATLDAVRPTLEARAKARKERVESERVAEARRVEETTAQARAVTARDNARSKALRAWVAKSDDEELKARMAEGFVPENEILDEVANELIDIPGFRAYEPLHKGDACECRCASSVKFDVGAPRYLDTFQYAKLQAVREAAPQGATVTPIEHRAACPSCKCVPLARIAARVALPWEGWMLVRQFLLQ